jgi:chemotaxis signal transduction protein
MMKKIVLLTLAGRDFSISVEKVIHVLPGPRLFPLICLRQELSGVFLYGDELVPVLELANVEELNPDAVEIGYSYVVILQTDCGYIGVPVDSAVTIVDVEDGSLKMVPPADVDHDGEYIFHFQGSSYPLLDVDGILARLPY